MLDVLTLSGPSKPVRRISGRQGFDSIFILGKQPQIPLYQWRFLSSVLNVVNSHDLKIAITAAYRFGNQESFIHYDYPKHIIISYFSLMWITQEYILKFLSIWIYFKLQILTEL